MNTLNLRRLAPLLAVAALLIATGCRTLPLPRAETAEPARGPYVQLATPHSIVVVWRIQVQGAMLTSVKPSLRYGKMPDQLSETVTNNAILVRRSNRTLIMRAPETGATISGATRDVVQMEARLAGLEPGTRYFYAVYNGDQRLTPPGEDFQFTTPPAEDQSRPLRFWVIGDSGRGSVEQRAVHQAMLEWTARDGRGPDLMLHLGDVVYPSGTDSQMQHYFFEPYEETLRHVPCWPAFGNHDAGSARGIPGRGPYFDAFVMPREAEAGGTPSGSESYYSFNWGQVHFISLNSTDVDRFPKGRMARWLKEDLAHTSARWVVAYWHHAPYTQGSHLGDSDPNCTEMRRFIMPILEAGGVDLVLSGHSHIYERSMLIDGAYGRRTSAQGTVLDDGDGSPVTPYRKSAGRAAHQGTVVVVAGNGGANISRNGTCPIMRTTLLEFGSLLVDVDGERLTGRMLNTSGEVRDTFAIVKSDTISPTRVAKPWQPPHWSSGTSETKKKVTPW